MARILSTTISAALIWVSPGLGAMDAFAQAARSAPVSAPVTPTVGVTGAASASNAGLGLNAAPGLQASSLVMPVSVLPAAQAPSIIAAPAGRSLAGGVAASRRAGAQAAVAAPVSGAARAGSVAASRQEAAGQVARISIGVDEALRAAGSVQDLEPSRAAGLGSRLQRLLTGERAALSEDGATGPAGSAFGSLRHDAGLGDGGGMSLGRPAGWDSIHRAAQASGAPAAPAPRRNGEAPEGDGLGGGARAPFFARVIASAMALGPAAYFGLPLLAAGAWIPGGLLALAGLGLAALPWLGRASSGLILGAPGVSIAALGTIAALTVPGWGMAVGGLVALAGWGFARFARGSRRHPGATEQMSAIFGALSATAAAGLILTGAAGWLAVGATALSSLFAARLLAELPTWVYEGVGHALTGVYKSVKGVHQVLGSIRKDTVLYDRLVRLTERHVKRFGWFALVWLGGLWVPALLSELIQLAASVVAGLALGVVQSPILFAWGALDEVHERGPIRAALAVRVANWGRMTFDLLQGSKTTIFNPVERRLLPLANHKSRIVSLLGGVLIRLAHVGWLAYAAVGGALVPIVTFVKAFTAPAEAWDPAKHSTSALRLARDPLAGEKPDEKDEPIGETGEPFFPKLIGTAVALTPLYFFGLPFLGAALSATGSLFIASGLAVALLPLMPQGTPVWLRAVPGAALGLAGLAAAATGGVALVGSVVALAGWGLANFAIKEHSKDRYYYVTDPEYVGAFFGALAAVTALGAGLAGVGGLLGLGLTIGGSLVSGLAIYHLPRWFWSGAEAALRGLGTSPSRVHRVMNFWDNDTKFERNLNRWWSHWSGRSEWHWSWLWPTLGAFYLMKAYDYLVAGAAGLALGVVRAPVHYLWGAAYRISRASALTRFIGGFAKSWLDRSEGSKPLFDTWVKPLVPGIDRATENGRPTIGAVFFLGLSRLVQLAWLARIVLWSPVILIRAVIDGVRAVREGAPADGRPDKLDPDYL